MKRCYEFLGLRENPFKQTLDIKYFFPSKTHSEALKKLKRFFLEGENIFVLIGEPGVGKTLTIKKLISAVPEKYVSLYIFHPDLSEEELLSSIELKLGIRESNKPFMERIQRIMSVLGEKIFSGYVYVLIIDEAQNLKDEAFKTLKLLSDLEVGGKKLFRIVLVGQKNLIDRLKKNKSLLQKTEKVMEIKRLSGEETGEYIKFRIVRAGGRLEIKDDLVREVYKASKGVPRVINRIMKEVIDRACKEEKLTLDSSLLDKKRNIPLKELTVAGIFIALIIFGFSFLKGKDTSERETTLKGSIFRVSVPMLNLRERPSTKSDVIYILREGDRVMLIEKGPGTWIKVKVLNKDFEIEGWLNAKYVEREDTISR